MKRMLPNDKICLELLRSGKTIEEIVKSVGMKGSSSTYLYELAKLNNIPIERKERIQNPNYIHLRNIYKDNDNYKKDDKVKVRGKEYIIDSITKGSKNMYNCIDKLGFKNSFHAIDFDKIIK